MVKKTLAFVLVLALLLTVLPMPVRATELESAPITVTASFFQGDEDDGADGGWVVARRSFEVTPGFAGEYGYTYGTNVGADDVSALDALVAVHIAIFGDDSESLNAALELSGGSVMTAMMVETEGNFIFSVNGDAPHDGVPVFYSGMGNQYTGYAVNDAVIEDGDVVEFFLPADDGMYGMYTSVVWFEESEQKTDEITVEIGEQIELMLNGFNRRYIYNIPSERDPRTDGIDGASVALVELEPDEGFSVGTFGEVLGTTDDGEITLSFDAVGTYYVSAYADANKDDYIIPPWLTVTVTPPAGTVAFTPTYAAASVGVKLYSEADDATPAYTTTSGTVTYVVPGTYWVEGVDAAGSMGRVKTEISEDCAVTFFMRRYRVSNDSYSWVLGTHYTFEIVDINGDEYVPGDNEGTAGQNTYYMRYTVKNGDTVYYTATPIGDKESGFLPLSGSATYNSAGSVNVAIPVEAVVSVTVPAGSELFVGSKSAHFVPFAAVAPKTEPTDNGDNTVTYTYSLAKGGAYNYRVTQTGKVTFADKLTANDAAIASGFTVTQAQLDAGGNTPSTIVRDLTANNGYNVADIFLNVNEKGYLALSPGGTHQIVNIRIWQAVDTVVGNYFIEPDYHYEVINISGSPVTVSESGLITAAGNGLALVLVTYNAMTYNSGVGSDKFYGAIWPENTGVIVVSVGEQTGGFETGLTVPDSYNDVNRLSGKRLDAELDVIYYEEAKGGAFYTFTPDPDTTVDVMRPVVTAESMTFSGDFTADGVFEADGEFTVKLIEGRNILRLRNGGKVEYQVITAKAVTVTISNVTDPGNPVEPGDTISVVFNTVFHPANKLAGVYNMAARIGYVLPSGSEVFSTARQHDFASYVHPSNGTSPQRLADFTIPVEFEGDRYTLTTGRVNVSTGLVYGDPYGSHRGITYEVGKAPGFASQVRPGDLAILPDVTVYIGENYESLAALEQKINDAHNLNKSQYTNASWTAMVTYLDLAIAVAEDPDATGSEIAGALTALTTAIGKLVAAGTTAPTNPGDTEGDPGQAEGTAISVTFRLVGSTKSSADVDLTDNDPAGYNGASYVTWIPTKSYSMVEGDTVYNLFVKALQSAGLSSVGANSNYVSTIWAPAVVGGYALSEFTNGPYSGWMYTVNGAHTAYGVQEQVLFDGDAVVWHYVNDYRYEVSDLVNDPGFPSKGDGTLYDRWVAAADTAPVAPAPALPSETSKEPEIVESEIKPEVTVTEGKVTAAVSTESVKAAVDEAVKAASANGGASLEVRLNVKSENGEKSSAVEVTVPAEAVLAIAEAKDVKLTLSSDTAEITLDQKTLSGLAGSLGAGEALKITAGAVDNETALTESQRELAGDNPVIEFSIMAGENRVSGFEGAITITVPYTPKTPVSEAEAELMTVYYLDENGNLTEMRGARYDPVTGTITFSTTHFSKFMIAEWINPFCDAVRGEWYYGALRYVSSAGIMSGVSVTEFAPESELTRAMLLTILYRLEGEPFVSDAGVMPFTDLADGEWYTGAVVWAHEIGLVTGYGDGRIGVNDLITREQAVTLLHRYAKYKGLEVSAEYELSGYDDAELVSAWSLDAIKWGLGLGIITGRSSTVAAPLETVTRVETAVILQRFSLLG